MALGASSGHGGSESFMAAGRAGSCKRGQTPARPSAILQQVTTGISCPGPGGGFCHPTGQVACCVLRSSFGLVFPRSKAQRLTPAGQEQPRRGALQRHKETFSLTWPQFPPDILNIKLVTRQIQGREGVSPTYQKT